jgi:hypothetical protein
MSKPFTNLSETNRLPSPELKYYKDITLSEFLKRNPEAAGTLEAIEIPFDDRNVCLLRSKERPELAILYNNDSRKGPNPDLKFNVPYTDIQTQFAAMCNCCGGSTLAPYSQIEGVTDATYETLGKIETTYQLPDPIKFADEMTQLFGESNEEYKQRFDLFTVAKKKADAYNNNSQKSQTRLDTVKNKLKETAWENQYFVYLKQLEDFLLENNVNTLFVKKAFYGNIWHIPQMGNIKIYDDSDLDTKFDSKDSIEQALFKFNPEETKPE